MVRAEIDAARDAVRRRAWVDARELLTASDAADPLEREDLERLALTYGLLGEVENSAQTWVRAYNAWLADDGARAARCAFWAGLGLIRAGEMARGGAWLGRASAALEDAGGEHAEAGLLMVPRGVMLLDSGQGSEALATFEQVLAIGERFSDPDVLAFGHLGRGQALIATLRRDEGLRELDEAMVAVTSDDVMPIVPGIVYCAVIHRCLEAFDAGRAQEWTDVLDAWSAPQQGLVPFRGQCLVHRSQIKQMHGEWTGAFEEAEHARDRLSDPPGQPAVGLAHYQLAELHRVRGAFADSERAYRDANAVGHPPQPGLALLRLGQGKVDDATGAITTALAELHDRLHRARLLPAAIEIALAAGDLVRAREAADELEAAAAAHGAPLLKAVCQSCLGAVLIAEGDPAAAIPSLRAAQRAFQELDFPYEVARVRVLIAAACRSRGDTTTADLEVDAARRTFLDLGASADLAALDATDGASPGGLTPREAEVLRLVATGKTNKAIAEDLVISQKTVARHLSNIFVKIDVATRAEATAYAFKNDLA